MSRRILVVVKPPKQEPFVAVVENRLEKLQRLVDGYIEVGRVLAAESEVAGIQILCNEKGLLRHMEPNLVAEPGLRGMVGQIVAVGVKGEEFASLPTCWVPKIMKMLSLPKERPTTEMDGQVSLDA